MATMLYQVLATPDNVLVGTDALTNAPMSLAVGKTYSARYVSLISEGTTRWDKQSILALESAVAPDAGDAGLPVQHLEDLIIHPRAGEQVYVWSVNPGRGILVINEVP